MADLGHQLISVFFGYFAIMNPLANTAVFVGLTDGLGNTARRHIATRALALTFGIVFVFAALGKTIFHFFGVGLPALRLTGGVLVFIIGYQMLHGEGSKMHSSGDVDNDADDNLAVSPLAVPLLAGPGTIATTMSFAAQGGWMNVSVTVAVFALMCLLTWVCFVYGERLLERIGTSALQIVTRLMGLILAVIGAQMLIDGVRGAFALAGVD
ncbi:MarC family protein [Nitrogeniibacter aestuarii]|uniref:MarC family protein n=1 Tax=Nitrogeniibacter aestuarii TaxID=2815343 RepID=UPI001D104AED|nr:MarC family protein [Nitrogeniibacter aestuarii]